MVRLTSPTIGWHPPSHFDLQGGFLRMWGREGLLDLEKEDYVVCLSLIWAVLSFFSLLLLSSSWTICPQGTNSSCSAWGPSISRLKSGKQLLSSPVLGQWFKNSGIWTGNPLQEYLFNKGSCLRGFLPEAGGVMLGEGAEGGQERPACGGALPTSRELWCWRVRAEEPLKNTDTFSGKSQLQMIVRS